METRSRDSYDWSAHFSVPLTECGGAGGFREYRLETPDGWGTVRDCAVFPGVQTLHTDLYLPRCSRPAPPAEGVVEINYCLEGRYACEISSRYYFYVSPGDLSEHLTIEALAEEYGVAHTTVKTVFKSVYGESIRTFLKSCRLQEAQRLLRETEQSVAEVAAAVGYGNPGKFASAFRERFGRTPGEYRRDCRLYNKGNAESIPAHA